MKKITKYFLQGLLYIAPFGITVYIIYAVFKFADNLLRSTLQRVLSIDIPGLGLVIIVILIILTGIIGHTFIARPFKAFFNVSAFVGKEKKFDKPVIVLVNPISNLQKLGFLTEDDLTKLDEKEKVAVYFPHSYNFSGELFIVPKENVRPININPAEAMKFIVSAGVSGWAEIESSDN